MTARWFDVPTSDWLTMQRQLRGLASQVNAAMFPTFANATVSGTATFGNVHNVLTVDTSAGNVTITLPTVGANAGKTITIVKTSAANTLTVDGAGALISGSATEAWTAAYDTRTIYDATTEWLIL